MIWRLNKDGALELRDRRDKIRGAVWRTGDGWIAAVYRPIVFDGTVGNLIGVGYVTPPRETLVDAQRSLRFAIGNE